MIIDIWLRDGICVPRWIAGTCSPWAEYHQGFQHYKAEYSLRAEFLEPAGCAPEAPGKPLGLVFPNHFAFKNPALKGPICPHQQELGPQGNVSVGHTHSCSPFLLLEAATDPDAFLKLSCSGSLWQCEIHVWWCSCLLLKQSKRRVALSRSVLSCLCRKEDEGRGWPPVWQSCHIYKVLSSIKTVN